MTCLQSAWLNFAQDLNLSPDEPTSPCAWPGLLAGHPHSSWWHHTGMGFQSQISCESPMELLTINTGRFWGSKSRVLLQRQEDGRAPGDLPCTRLPQLPSHRSMKNSVQQLFSEIPGGIRTRRGGQRCGGCGSARALLSLQALPARLADLSSRSPRLGTLSCCWLGGMTASTNTAAPVS